MLNKRHSLNGHKLSNPGTIKSRLANLGQYCPFSRTVLNKFNTFARVDGRTIKEPTIFFTYTPVQRPTKGHRHLLSLTLGNQALVSVSDKRR